jgi:iron complex outermembrane receptor protein
MELVSRARRTAIHAARALLMVVAVAAPAWAQEAPLGVIGGRVIDAGSGQPVAAAVARLLEAHRDKSVHEDGRFEFEALPAGTYTLLVRRLGYRPSTQTVEVRAGGRTDVEVRLSVAPVQLAASVVTGTLSERPRDEVLSPTSVVADAELDRRLQATLGQTLQAQPGVTAQSIGPATSRPVIRGLSGDRIVLLEDGQRPGDMSSFSGDHAVAIEPITAKQIEVVRGPMSLLYGSSALGGVVNVIRDEVPSELPEDFHGTATAQGNSASQGGALALSGTNRLGRLAWRGEGSARKAGDVRTPGGTLGNSGMQTFGGSVGAGVVGAQGHVGGAYRYYRNDYGVPGGFAGSHAGGADIEMERHTTRLEAERHFADAPLTSTRATAQYTHYYHAEFEPSGAIGTEFAQRVASGDLVARHEHAGPFTMGAFGVRGQFRDISTGGTLQTPSTRDYQAAGFVVEEIGAGAARVQLGARYDWAHYEPQEAATVDVGGERIPVAARTFGSVSGSVGVLHTIRPGIRAGLNVSRAYRTPDFNELYSNGPHLAASTFEVGDPRLGIETGLGVDAFVRITRERVRAEVAAFRNALSGYIYPSSRGRAELGAQGFRPKLQYTNGDAVLLGADGSLELELASRLALHATASSVFGEFTSPLAPIPVITASDTTFVQASKHPPLLPPVNGRVELRYESPRVFGGTNVRASAAQDRLGDFESATPGYAVWGLDAGVRFLRGYRLQTLTLRVDNLFDREYRDHLSRTKDVMPEPGRDVSLVYRLQF